jgi:Yip1-like protein
MGAGMQQPPMQQGGGGVSAILDLVKVVYEPGAVFGRVKGKPRFLMPFLGLAVAMLIIAFTMKPFFAAGIQAGAAEAASRLTPEQAARMPSAATQATFFVAFTPIVVLLSLLIGAGLLWVTVSVAGSEAGFKSLLSVLTYSYMTYVAFSILTAVVLHVRGVESVASMADVRAQLGLDLLAPNAGKFLSAFLGGINPFSIWGVWTAGTGIAVTTGASKNAGYVAAGLAYLVGLLLLSVMSIFQQG